MYILILVYFEGYLIRELGIVGNGDGSDGDQLVIQPILPGVNIPNSELGYYFIRYVLRSTFKFKTYIL